MSPSLLLPAGPWSWTYPIRFVLRLLLGLLALVLVLTIALAILLQTNWAKQEIRKQVQASLAELLVGEVRIASISGNPLDSITFGGIEISDASGRRAIAVGRLVLDYDLLALLRKRIVVEELGITSLRIEARRDDSGAINLTQLLRPSEKESEFDWPVLVERLSIDGSAQIFGGPPESIGVEAQGLSLGEGQLGAKDLVAQFDGSFLALTQSSYTSSTRTPRISGSAVISPELLALVSSSPPLSETLLLNFATWPHQRGHALLAWLDARAGLQRVRTSVELNMERARGRGRLRVEHLNLGPSLGAAGATNLSGTAFFRGRGTSLESLAGDATLEISGQLFETHIEELAVEASIREQLASLGASLQVPGAEASMGLLTDLKSEPLQIQSARLHLDAPELSRVARPYADLSGRLLLDAEAEGPLSAPNARVRLLGQEIRAGGLPIGPVDAEIQSRREGSSLHVEAQSARLGPMLLSAQARIAPGELSAEIRELDLELSSLRGVSPSTAALGGRIRMRGTLESSGQDLRANLAYEARQLRGHPALPSLESSGRLDLDEDMLRAQLSFAAAREQRLRASLALRPPAEGLDLAAWRALDERAISLLRLSFDSIDLAAPLRSSGSAYLDAGRASGRLELRNGRRGTLTTTLTGLGIERVGLRRGRASLRASLETRSLELELDANARSLGRLKAQASARPPARPLLLSDWKRGSAQRLDTLSLTLAGVSLTPKRLASLGIALPFNARLSASLSLDKGRRGEMEITGTGLRGEGWPRAGQSKIRLQMDAGRASVEGELQAPETLSAQLRGSARAPRLLLSPGAWNGIGKEWLQSASINARAPLSSPLLSTLAKQGLGRGEVSLNLSVGEALRSLRLDSSAIAASSPWFTRPLRVRATTRIDERELRTELRSFVDKKAILSLQAHSPIGSQLLWRDPGTNVRRSPITADLEIGGLPVSALASILEVEGLEEGWLAASLAMRGSLEQPALSGRISTSAISYFGSRVPPLVAETSLRRERATLDLRTPSGRGRDAPHLKAQIAIDNPLAESAQLTASSEARKWPLRPLSVWLPDLAGELTGSVRADGPLRRPSLEGRLRAEKLAFRSLGPIWYLRDGSLEANFNSSEAHIEAQAKSGSGRIELDARASYAAGQRIEASGRIRSDALPLRVGGLRLSAGTDTRVRVERDEAGEIVARVDVGDSQVVLPKLSGGGKLHPSGDLEDLVILRPESKEERRRRERRASKKSQQKITVHIKAPSTIFVRSPEGRATVSLALVYRSGPPSSLVGTASSDTGIVELFGHRYRIERAAAQFGGDPANPQLNVRLVRDFSNFTMSIELTGAADKPELRLTADPPIYDESQLLAFALGANPEQLETNERGVGARASGAAAGLLTGQVTSLVRDRLPIDVLRVELGEDSLSAAKVTTGKWITEKLFLAYRHRFEAEPEENTAEAVIEYWIWRRWLLEAYFGDRGAAGADLLWVRRF